MGAENALVNAAIARGFNEVYTAIGPGPKGGTVSASASKARAVMHGIAARAAQIVGSKDAIIKNITPEEHLEIIKSIELEDHYLSMGCRPHPSSKSHPPFSFFCTNGVTVKDLGQELLPYCVKLIALVFACHCLQSTRQ